jgi:hypothetical protein
MKTGVKWVNRCLVLSPYSIGLCRNEEDFKRELKRLKLPRSEWTPWLKAGSDATVHFFEKVKSHALCCIVCINGKSRNRSVISGLLVHEAEHIWREIKVALNEKEPSVEFEALAMQSITQYLIEAYYEE